MSSSHQAPKPSLSDVLESSSSTMLEALAAQAERKEAEDMEVEKHKEGMCVECTDQPATVHCENCCDDYCEVCFYSLHKRGNRKRHEVKKIQNPILTNTRVQIDKKAVQKKIQEEEAEEAVQKSKKQRINKQEETDSDDHDEDDDMQEPTTSSSTLSKNSSLSLVGNQFVERAKYIPLRLNLTERKALRLVESTLKVSEYTDKIDIISYKSKAGRIHTQVKDICAILSGLVVASDYTAGQQLIKDKQFADNEKFFQQLFEIIRRHKIMNPEKLRGEYGKLIYMLMDTELSEVQDLLEFKCISPIKMVYDFLESKGGEGALKDELITIATMEIIAENKSRNVVQKEIKAKEKAIDYIAKRYSNASLSEDDIKHCLYSIGDNNAFLRQSRDPCDRMIQYLTTYFKPNEYEQGLSLGIQAGLGGARLSHSHTSQYNYVLQSLYLWREVQHEMFKLWFLAETDLLNTSECPYRLRDTGQGLNRVQSAPRLYKALSTIVYKVQQKVGSNWVGSSVIHLGDHNVPNALYCLDKYTQVPRILNPIVTTLNQLDGLCEKNPGIAKYIKESFGGPEKLKKDILADFFRHAFDGSGADNFFDAGSCIDGRLTSAWNWCSLVEKKPYFPAFLLTGFIGFDGNFQQ